MKINEINRLGALNQYQKQRHPGGTDRTDKTARKDEVHISSEAKALQEAQGADASRQNDRLAMLKKSVHNGTYHIDARELADRLLPYFTQEKGD